MESPRYNDQNVQITLSPKPTNVELPINTVEVDEGVLPYELEQESIVINGKKQMIYIVSIDLSNTEYEFKPVLAQDRYFGYELLSGMDNRYDSILAVNAGFSGNYGEPIGLFIKNNEIISLFSRYPSILIYPDRAIIEECKDRIKLKINNKEFSINAMNSFDTYKEVILYTNEFGRENRLTQENITITVRNNIIDKIEKKNGSTAIPTDGYLLSLLGLSIELVNEFDIKVNDIVEYIIPEKLKDVLYAYECGSWLVKEGVNIVPKADPIVGNLNSQDPRTAIGIDKEGRIKIIIVDGRQPNLSYGMTGDELSNYMISKGIVNGVMLDGGASTQLIINHEIINSLSAQRERMLAAGFVLVKKD